MGQMYLSARQAFSETDFTAGLKKFDVPTLILQGDEDQIVPNANSAEVSDRVIMHFPP